MNLSNWNTELAQKRLFQMRWKCIEDLDSDLLQLETQLHQNGFSTHWAHNLSDLNQFLAQKNMNPIGIQSLDFVFDYKPIIQTKGETAIMTVSCAEVESGTLYLSFLDKTELTVFEELSKVYLVLPVNSLVKKNEHKQYINRIFENCYDIQLDELVLNKNKFNNSKVELEVIFFNPDVEKVLIYPEMRELLYNLPYCISTIVSKGYDFRIPLKKLFPENGYQKEILNQSTGNHFGDFLPIPIDSDFLSLIAKKKFQENYEKGFGEKLTFKSYKYLLGDLGRLKMTPNTVIKSSLSHLIY